MGNKNYINPNNPVYFSYAWAKSDKPDLEKEVEVLCKLLVDNNIYYKRDKDNLCPYRCDFIKTQEEIGNGAAIIVVISEKYIKSLNCMFEWHMIHENGKIWERVFPIVLEDARITEDDAFLEYKKYFEERKYQLVQKQTTTIPLKPIEAMAVHYRYYVNDLDDMYQYLSNYNYTFSQGNHTVIIEQLKEHLKKFIDPDPDPKPVPVILPFSSLNTDGINNHTNEEDSNNSIDPVPANPHFSLPIPDGLVDRANEEENLFNLVSKNRIINLVGVGGSGKSSLTYLFLDKHKNDFNEIAYVVVNNNIKDDMVEQLNKTLRLQIDAGKDPFLEIISSLRENYNSKKPNLLILDINETSDMASNVDMINQIIQNKNFLDGWHFLIISRENMDTRNRIEIHTLNDKNDIDFLKELFLAKAGRRYQDFGDFNQLFKVIHYNPLLAEQLGYYLKNQPRVLGVYEIKKILYGDSFLEKDMRGKSAQRHDETIISFLKNLIKYNELSQNEKDLLRHFALWPSDYISFDVIEDLLKGVFKSEEQLVNTLASLCDRSILTTNSGQTLSYKLHGLLADSLREQIDIPNEDYGKYLDNIERITEYSYYKFLPFIDCIVNSLCEYDITTGYYLYSIFGVKLLQSWKYDYCQKVLEKTKKRIEDIIKSDKDNPFYQSELAGVYNNLAILQYDLGVYASSEQNYNNAIEILEQLPKDNPEYQNDLARTYTNLGNLQTDHLGDNESSEQNYKKAIEIREQLPKDNPEYQYGLAIAYMNLGILQYDLGDYASSEQNYNNAIGILEQLPKDNPEYQNGLARTYSNLGNLQRDHLEDYESSEQNYNQAIEILEQLPKDNPKYQNYLARTYSNLGNLQRDHLGDYSSSEQSYNHAIRIYEQLPKDNPESQRGLAWVCNELAYCYLAQKKYHEAIDVVNQAIDLAKVLSDKDSKYLIDWINYKHSLAEIVFNNNDVEKAKQILVEIKLLAEACLAQNPNDNWTQTVNKSINELLEKLL